MLNIQKVVRHIIAGKGFYEERRENEMCLAQVKNQKSYCYSIKASDSKNQCLAMVK